MLLNILLSEKLNTINSSKFFLIKMAAAYFRIDYLFFESTSKVSYSRRAH